MALLAEQKAKKIEVSAFDANAGPKISASLWASLGESHISKWNQYGHLLVPFLFANLLANVDWPIKNF